MTPLAVADDCTRECLGGVADTSLSGRRVAQELDNIIRQRGRPASIVSDNGMELTSNAILEWADKTGVGWHYIAPGEAQRRLGEVGTISLAVSPDERRP